MIKDSTTYGNFLMALLLLFSFRVFAQLLQAISPVPFLPPFETWHSDFLPYDLLIIAQLFIIALCGLIVWRFKTKRIRPNLKVGKLCIIVGLSYFVVMIFRLVAGFSFASTHPWLSAFIPTLFHLVLASFLFTVGLYHSDQVHKIMAKLIYPVIMLVALLSHSLSTLNGINIYVATYIPVLIAAALISYLEIVIPYRAQWKANHHDIKQDLIYMALVQMILPRFLGFLSVMILASIVQNHNAVIGLVWPHTSPVIFQAFLMLVLADFLRYWLHRLSHSWKPLWKLHEVHHSSEKLYWMNVGKFHPLEKGLQFVFDALPFILLGVSQEALALYFVFYAVNGFFQHCNIDVRLGRLNYLISGPELHRWHHSKHIHESDNNFGNNLIIWDWLFSTRYLPEQRAVEKLGVLSKNYPTTFSTQLLSPFVDTEKSK